MPKLSQLTPDNQQHVLIYGPPKTGKTKLVGQLAQEFTLWWFDLESGSDTLFTLPKEWQENINLFKIPDTKDFPIAIETMLKVIKGGNFRICNKHGKIMCLECGKLGLPSDTLDTTKFTSKDILVVDSITQLVSSAISHITRKQSEDYKLEWDDWGMLGGLMDRFFTYAQQAPFHLCFISHDTETDPEKHQGKIIPVGGTRTFSRNMAKYFGHVVYAEIRNGSHRFGSSTLYANNVIAGSRTNSHLENMKEPTLLDIMKGNVQTVQTGQTTQQVTNSLSALRAKLGNKG